MPTESFFPKMKYDRHIKLPAILKIQNTRGTTGFCALRDAHIWTNQRLVNIDTPT